MGAMEHLTIAVPVEIAERMRDRVASGDFLDLNEVVLEALLEFEADGVLVSGPKVDDDLQKQMVAALAAYDADPSRGLTVEQVRANLARSRARREQAAC